MENNSGKLARPGYGPRPATSYRETRALSKSRAAVLDAVRATGRPTALPELTEATGLHANTLREHLEALVNRGLVRRGRSAPSGRGRPAWLYEAVDPSIADAGTEYAGLAAALAAHLHRTSADPDRDAVEAGRAWGRDLAHRAGPPSTPSDAAARRKILDILDAIGFAPRTDEGATTAHLTRCPLLETAKEYPDVVCGVHLGIVRGALEEYGADSVRTQLLPFAELGSCRLELLTTRVGR